MIRTILTMQVRPGAEPEFEQAWLSAADGISRYPGNRGQSMMRDADEPGRYFITGDWQDADALREFQRSPQREALSAALDPLRVSATRGVTEVLHQLDAYQEAM